MILKQATYPTYPMVRWLIRHGPWIVPLFAALPLVATGIAAAMGIAGTWVVAVGCVISVAGFVLLRAFVEVLQIVADVLLPR